MSSNDTALPSSKVLDAPWEVLLARNAARGAADPSHVQPEDVLRFTYDAFHSPDAWWRTLPVGTGGRHLQRHNVAGRVDAVAFGCRSHALGADGLLEGPGGERFDANDWPADSRPYDLAEAQNWIVADQDGQAIRPHWIDALPDSDRQPNLVRRASA